MSVKNEKTFELLKLADYNHPVLRQATERVHFPLSNEDKKLIASMKYSIQSEQLKEANAPWDSAAGMAANQWGYNKSIFLYCPEGDPNDFLEVVINPSYEPIPDPISGSVEQDEVWEACFSVPLTFGNVRRSTHIRVQYQNEQGKTLVKELSGWPARVWQHENDHLLGILFEDPKTGKCLEKRVFASKEDLETFLKDRNEKRESKGSKVE